MVSKSNYIKNRKKVNLKRKGSSISTDDEDNISSNISTNTLNIKTINNKDSNRNKSTIKNKNTDPTNVKNDLLTEFLQYPRPSKIDKIVKYLSENPFICLQFMKSLSSMKMKNTSKKIINKVIHDLSLSFPFMANFILYYIHFLSSSQNDHSIEHTMDSTNIIDNDEIDNTVGERNKSLKKDTLDWKYVLLPFLNENLDLLDFFWGLLKEMIDLERNQEASSIMKMISQSMRSNPNYIYTMNINSNLKQNNDATKFMFERNEITTHEEILCGNAIMTNSTLTMFSKQNNILFSKWLCISLSYLEFQSTNKKLLSDGMKDFLHILTIIIPKIKLIEKDLIYAIQSMLHIIDLSKESAICIIAAKIFNLLIIQFKCKENEINIINEYVEMNNSIKNYKNIKKNNKNIEMNKKCICDAIKILSSRALDERKTVRISMLQSLEHLMSQIYSIFQQDIPIEIIDNIQNALNNIGNVYLYIGLNKIKAEDDASVIWIEKLYKEKKLFGGFEFDCSPMLKFSGSDNQCIALASARILLHKCFNSDNEETNYFNISFIGSLFKIHGFHGVEPFRRKIKAIFPKSCLEKMRKFLLNTELLDSYSPQNINLLQFIYLFQDIVFSLHLPNEIEIIEFIMRCCKKKERYISEIAFKTFSIIKYRFDSLNTLSQFIEEEYFWLLQNSDGEMILSSYYSKKIASLYKRILQIETMVSNGMLDTIYFLQSIKIAISASYEHWCQNSIKKYKEKLQENENDTDNYLKDQKNKREEENFKEEFVNEMIKTGFLSCYVEMLQKIVSNSNEFLTNYSIEEVICVIQCLGKLIEVSPEINRDLYIHIKCIIDICISEGHENSDVIIIESFRIICYLMKIIPNYIEEYIVKLFQLAWKDDSSLSKDTRECIIMMTGTLCIDRLLKNQELLVCFTDFLNKSDSKKKIAISILGQLISNSEDASQLAMIITSRYAEIVDNNFIDSSSPIIFLVKQWMKRKDLEIYLKKIVEHFMHHPTLKLSNIISLLIPSSYNASEYLFQLISKQGVYFFKRLRESNKDHENIFNYLLKCMGQLSRRHHISDYENKITKIYQSSSEWDEKILVD